MNFDDEIEASTILGFSQGVEPNDKDNDKSENVRVAIRCRPPFKNEFSIVKVEEDLKYVLVNDRKFYYDSVFGLQSTNDQVFLREARRLVESAFNGYNCTIFMYGQTGTGKTYTHSGLTLDTFQYLFTLIQSSDKKARFLVRASYYELYNENIRDLLVESNRSLEIRESHSRGVYVKDLSTYLVNNLGELEKLKQLGDKQRATATTKINQKSSRSHSIFTITIEAVNNTEQTESNQTVKDRIGKLKSTGDQAVRVGKLNLIDLAGSERQSKSGTSGLQLKEASRINLSLTCLSLVIRALTDATSTHVPYRNSKLTRILSSSLGGNSKTLLIACISPEKSNLDETLNTLRFAQRTKKIKNEAKINEDPKDALLKKYRNQIEELKSKLRRKMTQSSGSEENKTVINSGTIKSANQNDGHANHEENEILNQLQLLRNKIMVGGVNLLDKATFHEKLLEASNQELEEKRRQELNLKAKLDGKQKLIDKISKSKGTLEGQVIELDEKLKRALQMYHQMKEEHKDLVSEHEQLKDNLLKEIKATNKEIKYADSIIDDFIPSEFNYLINNYTQYDEQNDEWQIKYIALSGNNIAQTINFL